MNLGLDVEKRCRQSLRSREGQLGLWTWTWTQGMACYASRCVVQVERVTRPAGELYEELHETDGNSPLAPMTRPEGWRRIFAAPA